jgi:glutathione S-transferase
MKRPSIADLAMAAEWLDCNEGSDDEAGACARVAAWLRHCADEAELRALAREAGIRVGHLRQRLKDENSK